MKIKQLGANQTQVWINADTVVLFSYETPVAACVRGEYFKTSKKWSTTTSKHINQWLDGVKVTIKDQSFFDNLATR